MNKLSVLTLKFNYNNFTNIVHPVVVSDDTNTILIDCGYPNSLKELKMALKENNIDFYKLSKVIITHHDHDHMGNLAEIKKELPNIEIISSVIEKPYIDGRKKSLRLKQAEENYKSLPEEKKPDAYKFIELVSSLKHVNIDFTVKDEDKFSWCGGIEIIGTPGHMPGHISIYLKAFKTLVAGDELTVVNGKLQMANPQYTLDMKEAIKSSKKFLKYDIEDIVCYHGGEYKNNPNEALINLEKEFN